MVSYEDSSVDYLSYSVEIESNRFGPRYDMRYKSIVLPVCRDSIIDNLFTGRLLGHFPEMRAALDSAFKYNKKQLPPGELLTTTAHIRSPLWNNLTMLAFTARDDRFSKNQYAYIEDGFKAIVKFYNDARYRENEVIMLPLVGLEEGIDLNIVNKIIQNVFDPFNHEVIVSRSGVTFTEGLTF